MNFKPISQLIFKAGQLVLLMGLLFFSTTDLFAQSQTFNSSGTFTVPHKVTSVKAELWGGGGGGAFQDSRASGGGGGGGAFTQKNSVSVTPGTPITVTVGLGGVAGTKGTTGTGGDSSSFSGVIANGGNPGSSDIGGAGGVAGNTGDINTSGGNGGSGSNANGSGGGGGGAAGNFAGNGAAGNANNSKTGGSGGTGLNDAGSGGNGGNDDQNGSDGISPGGGGGGEGGDKSTSSGAGGDGRVIISWTCSSTLTSAAGTNNQSFSCPGTPISDITYEIVGAYGATFSGLPPGVTGTYANGDVTISGTPLSGGIFTYTVTPVGSCSSSIATGTITVGGTVAGAVTGVNSTILVGNSTGTLTLSGHSGTIPILRWQKKLNNNAYTNIANTSTTYTETVNVMGIWKYRAVLEASEGCGESYSGEFSLIVTNSTQSQTFTSSSTFTVPHKTTTVKAELWGGGGGGASVGGKPPGGGGGGGAYSMRSSVSVVSGTSYDVVVGLGGTGGLNGAGETSGGESSFLGITANGGIAGLNNTGGAGGAASSSGDINFSGGSGGDASTGNERGGGGGGASANRSGTGANGSSTTTATGGTGGLGVDGGGSGGAGGDAGGNNDASGISGSSPGGGGGGEGGDTDQAGNGGDGQVILTWACFTTLYSEQGTDNQLVCLGSPITTIHYEIYGDNNATVTGLPPGVDGEYTNGDFIISGTPTSPGTYTYTITPSGVCNAAEVTGTIVVTESTTWTGAVDTDWHNSANWDACVPTATIDAVIPTGLTNYPSIASSASVQELTIESGAELTLTGDFLDTDNQITNIGTLIYNSSSDATISQVISGTGNLTKQGTGALTLSGNNTYSGTSTVSAGELIISSDSALGSTDGGTIVTSGGVLRLQGGISVGNEALSIAGNGPSGNAALDNVSGDNSWAGPISLTETAIIRNISGNFTISNTIDAGGFQLRLGGGSTGGVISGVISNGSLNKISTGTWTLSGDNTFSGGTQVSNGQLNINHAGALGTGSLAVDGESTIDNTSGSAITLTSTPAISLSADLIFGGTYSLNLGEGTITMEADRTITTNGSETLTLGGALSASSYSLTKAGSGTLAFGSNAVSLKDLTISAGTFTSTSGTLSIGGGITNSGIFNNNSGTVDFNASDTQTIAALTYHNLTISGTGTNSKTAGGNITVNGVLNLSASNASASQGALDIPTGYLDLGVSAAVTGTGNITGTVRRSHLFTQTGTLLTFTGANQGLVLFDLPDQTDNPLTLYITASTGTPITTEGCTLDTINPVKRYYTIWRAGANWGSARSSFRHYYLDSEFPDGANESSLSVWKKSSDGSTCTVQELGVSNSNTLINFVGIARQPITTFISETEGHSQIFAAPTQAAILEWNGSVSSYMTNLENWTPQAVPSANVGLVIPHNVSFSYNPILPEDSVLTAKSMLIEEGKTLSSANNSTLKLVGSGQVFSRENSNTPDGTDAVFNQGNSTILIESGAESSIAGIVTLHNLTVAEGSELLVPGEAHLTIEGTFTNNGTIIASTTPNNFITFSGSNQTIPNTSTGKAEYNNLIISGSGTVLPTGFDLFGNFTYSGTGLSVGSSTLTMKGGKTQSITATTPLSLYNLTIANTHTTAPEVTLGSDLTVTNVLTLTNGKLTSGANRLILSSAASLSGQSAFSYIQGNLRRFIPNTFAPTIDFPIGDANGYRPVLVDFAGTVSGSGYLDASTETANPSVSSGLDQSKYVSRKWTLTNGGVGGFTTYSPTFTFGAGDIQGEASTSAFVVRKLDSSDWSATTTGTKTANSTQATELESFSEFYIGEPAGLAVDTNPVSISVCEDTENVQFTASSGSFPLVSIQWYRNGILIDGDLDGGIYSGFNTSTLNISVATLALNLNQYEARFSNINGVVSSDPAVLTVFTASLGGTLSGTATVCSGTNSTLLTISGQTGNVIRWESSTDEGTSWSTISNTSTTYTAENLTTTTRYRAVVKNGECSEAFSSEMTVTVDPVTVPGSISGATSVCTGTNSTLLTLSGYTGSILDWEYSINGGSSWTSLSVTTSTYTATNLSATTQYRAKVKSGVCSEAYTESVTITVDPLSVGGTAAAASTQICGGTTTNITLSGYTGSIQWQQSTNGTDWTNVTDGSGETSATLTTPALTEATYFRAAVTSGTCTTVYSNSVQITLLSGSAGTISGAAPVCTGDNSTTLILSGQTGSIIQWEFSTNGGGSWIPISSTSSTLLVEDLTQTTLYRADVDVSGCGIVYTVPVTIQVDPISVGGTVAASSSTLCEGESTSLTLSGYTGTIQWQQSLVGGENENDWVDVSTGEGGTTDEYITAALAQTTYYYRAKVTSSVCSLAYSNTLTFTVNPRPAAPTAGDVSAAYTGSLQTASATAPDGSTVVWYDAETDGTVTTAPSGTDMGTYSAWAASLNASGCESVTRTLVTLEITPVALTVTADDQAKTYDGIGFSAFTATITGFVNEEDDSVITGSVTYSGTATTATFPGPYTIIPDVSGLSADNYTFTPATGTLTIAAKELTIADLSAQNKVYDGNDEAIINGSPILLGLVSGENVELTGTPAYTFAIPNVGTAISITTSGYELTGTDALNYSLTQPTFTADITAKTFSISGLVVKTKVYDGNQTAYLDFGNVSFPDLVSSDEVTLDTTAYQANNSEENVGADLAVTVSDLALIGADAGNYSIEQPTGLTGDITPRILTPIVTVEDKIYDGLATASITGYDVSNAISEEDVNVSSGTASFDTKDVGEGKIVTLSGLTLTGADASNYELTADSVTTTAAITAKSLTITADEVTKPYGDLLTGGIGYTAFVTDGLQNGETIESVTVNFGNGAAVDDAIGTYNDQVSISNASGGTADLTNYAVSYVEADLTVTKRSLVVTALGQSKMYGETAPTSGTIDGDVSLSGLLDADEVGSVTLIYSGSPAGNLIDAGAGTYDITPSDLTLATGDLSNYTITYTPGFLTVDPAEITVTALPQTKPFGTTAPTAGTLDTHFSVSGLLLNGDTATGVTLDYDGSPAGNEANAALGTYTITPSVLVLDPGLTSNYDITYTTGTLTVVAGAASQLVISEILDQTAGTAFDVTVSVQDAGGNSTTVSGDTPITLSLASGTETLGGTVTGMILAGTSSVTISGVSYTKAESISLTAADTSGSPTLEAGTGNTFDINSAALSKFLIESASGASISNVSVSTAFSIKITAQDEYDNTVTSFNETVVISSSGVLVDGGGTTEAFTNGILDSHSLSFLNPGTFTLTATRSGGSESGTATFDVQGVVGEIIQRGTATTASTTRGTATNSITINLPNGIQEGDLLIANVVNYFNGTSSAATCTGWTAISSNNLDRGRITLLYRIASSNEEEAYTFTVTEKSTSVTGGIIAYSGVNTLNPFDVTPVTTTPTYVPSNNIVSNISEITTISDNSFILLLTGSTRGTPSPENSYSGWTATSPTALDELFDVGGGDGGQNNASSSGAAGAIKNAAGPTGTGSFNVIDGIAGRRHGALIIALRPKKYFKSKISGNWNSISSWEESIDNSTWSNASTIPNSGDISVLIQAGHTVTLDSATTAPDLTISAGGVLAMSSNNLEVNALVMEGGGASSGASITGSGTLTLGGNIFVTDNGGGSAGASIAAPIALGADRTINVSDDGTSAIDLTISGVISGAGFGLTKAGTGALSLAAANTYTGTTIVSQGTLIAGANAPSGSAGAFGNASSQILLGDASTGNNPVALLTGGEFTIARPIRVTNNPTSGGYSIGGYTANNSTFSGAIVLWEPLTISQVASGTLTVSGAITNNANLLSVDGEGNTSISGIIGSGTGGLTKNGSGTLTLSEANTYTGVTTINAGTVSASTIVVSGSSSLGNASSPVVLGSDSTPGTSGTLRYTGNAATFTRGITVNAGGGVITNETSNLLTLETTEISNGGELTLSNTGTGGTTVSSVISGAGSVVVNNSGSGVTVFGGENTYTGATTVSQGTLQLGTGNDRISNSSALTVSSGGTFDLAGFNENIGSIAGGGTITSSASGNPVLTTGNDDSTTEFSGIIENGSATSLNLTKTGSGTLTLSGANTHNGGITLNAGQLNLNSTGATGTGALTIGGATTIDNTSGGAITLSGNPALALNADLTFSGSYSLNLGTGTITMDADRTITTDGSATLTLGGSLSAPTFSLTKAGSSNLTFGSANATLNGLTVSAGTFTSTSGVLSIAGALSNSGTFVHNSGTVDFNGSGAQTIPGLTYHNLTTSTGGTKTLGGEATVNSVLTVGSSSTFDASSQTLNLAGSGTPLVISGTFTPSTSTVNYTSSSATRVTVANYHNLNLTNGDRTLPNSGTVGISGSFTPGSGEFTITGSTIDFNGSEAQTIPALTYNNITFSGAGSKILPTSLALQGNWTNNATLVLGSSTVTFSGGAQGISGTSDSPFSTLALTSSTSLDLQSNTSVATALSVTTPSITGSGTLSLNADATFTPGASGISITAPVNLGGAVRSFTVSDNASATNDLSISSVVSGSGGGINKLGDGSLTLSGANTFSGGLILNAGKLNLNYSGSGGISSALGSGTLTLNGGTIDNTSASAVTLSTTNPISLNTDLVFEGTEALNLGTGTITMGADRTVTTNGSTLTLGGTLSASSSLTKLGSGTLALGNNAVSLEDLTVSAGTFNSTSNTLSLAGNFVNNGTFGAGSGTLSISGDYTNNGTFTKGTGTVVLSGASPQNVGGSVGSHDFYNLTLNGAALKTLQNPLQASNTLTLTSGILAIGDYQLTSGTISGGSSGSYVRTNGTGRVVMDIPAGLSRNFQVGNSAYNPVSAKNNLGVSRQLQVRVADEANTTTNDDTKTVDRKWYIKEGNDGSADFTFDFTYNPAEAGAGFTAASNPRVGLFTDHWKRFTATSSGQTLTSTVTASSFSSDTQFITLGSEDAFDASQLSVTMTPVNPFLGVNNGLITIQAQNSQGIPTAVSTATDFQLTAQNTLFASASPTTGTLIVGAYETAVNNIGFTQQTELPNATVTATVTEGEVLSPGVSSPFAVVAAAIYEPTESGLWSAITWRKSTDGGFTWSSGGYASLFPTGNNFTASDLIRIPAEFNTVLDLSISTFSTIVFGTLEVGAAGTITLNHTEDDLEDFNIHVHGVLKNSGGTITNSNELYPIEIHGGEYIHARDGGIIPVATFFSLDTQISTCEVTGITSTAISTGLNQTFQNFIWDNAGQTTTQNLNGNLIVNNALNLLNGVITTTDSYYVLLGLSGTVTSSNGSRINGTLKRFIPNNTVTVEFPIGDATVYSPLILTFSGNVSGLGYVQANSKAIPPTDTDVFTGLSISREKYLNRRWSLSAADIGGFTGYSASFQFVGSDIVGSGANSESFIVQQLAPSASSWATPTVASPSGTGIQATGLTEFGEFAVGETCVNGVWVGNVSSDWFDADNWCGGIPTTTTDVLIVSTASNMPSIGNNGAVARNLTIQNGATLTITDAYTLTVYGNWSNSGTFNENSSTVEFAGTTAASIRAETFANVTISGSGTKTLAGNVTVSSVLTIGASSNLDGATFVLDLTGNDTPFVLDGTFTASTSTVNYSSTSATNVTAANYYNLNLSGGNRTLPNSEIVAIASVITPGSGTITATGSTVDFNGDAQAIPALTYYNVTLSGTGEKSLPNTAMTVEGDFLTSGAVTATAQAALAISGNVSINSGTTFTAGSFTHTVGGNWTKSGTFTATGSTIEFNGSESGSIGASNFNNLMFSGSGSKTASGVLTISGNVSITDNFTAEEFAHTVGGNWSNSGTFTATGSTIEFAGSGAGSIGPSNFNNLTFSGSGTKTATGVLNISGDVSIADNFTAGSFTHTVGGDWTTGGTFDPSGSTIEFSGSGTGNIGASNFNNVTFSGSGAKTATGILTIEGDVVIADNFTGGDFTHTVGGNWTNDGTFASGSGTVTFDGTSAQEIGGSTTSAFNNLTIANTASALTTAVDITVEGNLTVNSGSTLTPGAVNTIGGAGTLTGSGTVGVTRIGSRPDFLTQYPISTKTLTDLTVDYVGAGAQTVNAFDYGHLSISTNGTRTVLLEATGTIGISGTFSPSSTTTTYTTTGSTVKFNGTAQTVPVIEDYYNLTLAGSGTKNIAGSLDVLEKWTIEESADASLGAANHTAKLLYFDAAFQPSGTFGSTASSATNTNATYFGSTGTGVLTITCTQGIWTGAESTDWFDSANWCAGVPDENTDVLIASSASNQPAIGANGAVARNVTLQNGATLTISGAFSLTVYGNWANSGVFVADSGSTVNFASSNAATISADNFANVSFTGLGIKTIEGDITATGDITPVSAPMVITGNNTITLSSGNTMEISASGSLSTVVSPATGRLILEPGAKYLNLSNSTPRLEVQQLISGSRGWRMLGSPVDGASYDSFLGDLETQGYTGSNYASLQPNVLWWAETDAGRTTQGWRKPNSSSDLVPSGRGHYVFVFNGASKPTEGGVGSYADVLPITLSTIGSEFNLNSSSFNFGVTFTPRNYDPAEPDDPVLTSETVNIGGIDKTNYTESSRVDEGFNMIANPTASYIDFFSESGWVKTNVDENIYIWNPNFNTNQGRFETISSGTLSADRLIAPYQGFWVRSNAADPVLSMDKDVFVSQVGSFYGRMLKETGVLENSPVVIDLSVSGEGLKANSSLRLSDQGKDGIDPWDAFQLESLNNSWLNLYTLGAPNETKPLVINHIALPGDGEEKSIPLYIAAAKDGKSFSGTYTLEWNLPDNLQEGVKVVLMDHISKKAIDMSRVQSHKFSFDAPTTSSVGLRTVDGYMKTPDAVVFTHEVKEGQGENFRSTAGKVTRPFSIVLTYQSTQQDPEYRPAQAKLYPPSPNPFVDRTELKFYLPVEETVEIKIYDMFGQEVGSFDKASYKAGTYTLDWSPTAVQLASGIYLIYAQIGDLILTQRAIKQ